MDSSESSEGTSSMLSSDDDISSILEYDAQTFEPPPVFTELLELTTYDDGVQVKLASNTNIFDQLAQKFAN